MTKRKERIKNKTHLLKYTFITRNFLFLHLRKAIDVKNSQIFKNTKFIY
jgi:hypothetical protein